MLSKDAQFLQAEINGTSNVQILFLTQYLLKTFYMKNIPYTLSTLNFMPLVDPQNRLLNIKVSAYLYIPLLHLFFPSVHQVPGMTCN